MEILDVEFEFKKNWGAHNELKRWHKNLVASHDEHVSKLTARCDALAARVAAIEQGQTSIKQTPPPAQEATESAIVDVPQVLNRRRNEYECDPSKGDLVEISSDMITDRLEHWQRVDEKRGRQMYKFWSIYNHNMAGAPDLPGRYKMTCMLRRDAAGLPRILRKSVVWERLGNIGCEYKSLIGGGVS